MTEKLKLLIVKVLASLGDKRAIRIDAACRVKQCFDGLSLDRQSFVVNGIQLKDQSGETSFYRASEIDTAIKRLNAVLKDLRSDNGQPQ